MGIVGNVETTYANKTIPVSTAVYRGQYDASNKIVRTVHLNFYILTLKWL